MIAPTDKSPATPGEALAPMLRKAFRPAGLVPPDERAFSAQIAALCARIDRVGEDRGVAPFLNDQEHR